MTASLFSLFAMGLFAAGLWIAYKLVRGLGWIFGHLFQGVSFLGCHVLGFVKNTLVDTVHCVGALLTAVAIIPLALVNLGIGRFSSARYYGGALEDELTSSLLSLYRVALGHPLRFVGLGLLVDGFEKRIPDVVERAPQSKRRTKANRFDGYQVIDTLPEGGSGAQLFIARPDANKMTQLRERGLLTPTDVVIKSFAIETGSTLPQIVRESRALEAAKRLGYVLEHHLDEERFHYVMPYVKGRELGEVIRGLHEGSDSRGLGDEDLKLVLGLAQDLLLTLDRFHTGGMWHKDIKPSNLIVADDRAHLVDLGLVTPLQSAMTLTTHGTEYYRDPEMVRQALQGVKVHEVDGVRFDIYSAGAVLYSMVENSFPAHGSLSRLTRRAPEALQWIVHRAMADLDERYASARAMLADLAYLERSGDLFAVKPAELPSFSGASMDQSVLAASLGRTAPSPFLAGEAPEPGVFQPPALPKSEPRSLRRRKRRKVMAAAGLALIGLPATVAILEGNRHQGSTHIVSHGRDLRHDLRRLSPEAQRLVTSVDRLTRSGEMGVFPVGATRSADLHDIEKSPEYEVRTYGAGAAPSPQIGSASLDQAQPEVGGRVLILEDLNHPKDQPVVESLASQLMGQGFEVLGRSVDDGPEAIRITAGARHAVGLGDPNDPEALDALQAWLNQGAELDAVVWLGPGANAGSPVCRLLVRGEGAQAVAQEP